MSVAVMDAPGTSQASASAIAPLPVPISRMRGRRQDSCRKTARASSTITSVSGRGISTPGSTSRIKDQKAFRPVM